MIYGFGASISLSSLEGVLFRFGNALPHPQLGVYQRTILDVNQPKVVLFHKLAMSHFEPVAQTTAIRNPEHTFHAQTIQWWAWFTCDACSMAGAFQSQVQSFCEDTGVALGKLFCECHGKIRAFLVPHGRRDELIEPGATIGWWADIMCGEW